MRVGDLLTPIIERNPGASAVVLSVSERLGVVPQENLFRKKIALDNRERYLQVRYGDVVYNSYLLWNGAVGVCFQESGGCTSPAYVVLRPIVPGIGRFLHYFLRSNVFTSAVDAIASGSVTRRRTAPVEEVLDLEFDLPSVEYQQAANALLQALDDKIELNRRMSETLEAMARALFKSWFMDFDPVRAKMKGRWKRGQSLPGLPAHFYDIFPDRLVDSELGEIPEGWGVGALGDLAENPRRSAQPEQIAPSSPYIALEHMPRRSVALGDWGKAEGLASNKFVFKRGEILFGKLRPYFHKVGVAPVDGVCSTDIVVVTPKSDAWFGVVLGHTSSLRFVNYTTAGSTGTKMPRTSWSEMARYPIPLPPQSAAEAFTLQLRPVMERIVSSTHESRTLAALRDALLPKLVSGSLRVRSVHELCEQRS